MTAHNKDLLKASSFTEISNLVKRLQQAFSVSSNCAFNPLMKTTLLMHLTITVKLYFIFLLSIFFTSCTFYTKDDLIKNYNKNEQEILGLKEYFSSIVPTDKQVEIEFENSNKLFRFGVYPIDPKTKWINYPIFLEWNLDVHSKKVDSVLKSMNWNLGTLKRIKEKLDAANCIQIESGEPTKIGFQRSGMGMFIYNVFDHSLPDSLKKRFNSNCQYVVFSDKLVLEYGNGAVGANCFPKD
jgi:hypothetical protein